MKKYRLGCGETYFCLLPKSTIYVHAWLTLLDNNKAGKSVHRWRQFGADVNACAENFEAFLSLQTLAFMIQTGH